MHGPNAAGSLKQEKLREMESGDGKKGKKRDMSVVGGVCGALPREIDEMWGQGDSEGKKKVKKEREREKKKVPKNNRLLDWICATKLTHLHGSLGCQIG